MTRDPKNKNQHHNLKLGVKMKSNMLKKLILAMAAGLMVLAGTFHHRIDYPEPVHIEREKGPESSDKNEDTNRESTKEVQDSEASDPKNSPEDLKRLGMS